MELILKETIDTTFTVTVERRAAYIGILKCVAPDGEVLVEEPVPLAYGAKFGPDAADVDAWGVKCTAAVDAYNERTKA